MSQQRSSANDYPSQRTSSPVGSGAATSEYRAAAKRKLDDYVSSVEEDDEFDIWDELVSVRMRKDDSLLAVNSSSDRQNKNRPPFSGGVDDDVDGIVSASSLASCSYSSSAFPLGGESSVSKLQFFVRMIAEGKHVVVYASQEDTVESILERLQVITRISSYEMRLIYDGKQLQLDQSVAECGIQKDATLHLVARMRSTKHPKTCQIVGDMVTFIWRQCKDGTPADPYETPKHIKLLITEFFKDVANGTTEDAGGHFEIFLSYSAPETLAMLYVSTNKGNKDCADSSIRHFLDSCKKLLPKPLHAKCTPIVLEFCKLLRKVARDDPLYLCCRSTLGSLLDNDSGWRCSLKNAAGVEDTKGSITIAEIFPFVKELATKLSNDLCLSLPCDVIDFSAFLAPLRTAISETSGRPVTMPLNKKGVDQLLYAEEMEQLRVIFRDLLAKMDKCLMKVEGSLSLKSSGECELINTAWSQYLAILKELNEIAKLYKDSEEQFWTILRLRKASICALIVKYAKRDEDHQWLLQHKDVTDFESRRHLAMMMFPEVKEDYEDLHEMLIDRANLLEESFAYIGRAEPESLHGGLFMEFKNEEATGPGVLREWFLLVTQAIFNPHNALFLPCPSDRRRFHPNPASKVEPKHLEYFAFTGRVIALALMHKVQVGIVLDRVLFLQLAGGPIYLEDIKDADPTLYNSCKQILDMDPEFIDSDALGLTFVREVEVLGDRTVVELRPGGKNIVVNSKNRGEYVTLLIRHRFVTSISEQVSHFAKGFTDILSDGSHRHFFFQSLKLEDLDWMLYGSENAICVEDWKAHTEYNGFKETDPQISWFWKIIGKMPAERRKVLLFFWTSIKYLPVEGFRGLASRLYIYKSTEPQDRLPSSHTCFYRLCFPPYPSMAVMQDRIRVITQEHIGCSFGTW
ncbi:E3 ubiquitin-protein ligase UPL5 [Linum perenne]